MIELRLPRFLRVRMGLVLVCLQLAACAGLRDGTVGVWPEGIPPASYFEGIYERDMELHDYQSREEYLYWVRKFYEGTTLYPRGWSEASEDLLAEIDDPEHARRLDSRLLVLGRSIAGEWSKDTRVNRVENAHLAIWSVAVERSVGEGNVDETLDKITRDLEKLLSRELDAQAITAGRYHPQDPDDWFALE